MRVLVTAASKHAATSDIATAIAEGLRAAGLETIVASPESVESLEGYDGVILGSGVVRAPDGDYRPWEEIRAWSAGIAQDLADSR
jgi:menaquinone-dependent protoporphyrinogen IX oxidase